LRILTFDNTDIQDISVLKDMPLTALSMRGTRVHDLSPLRGLALEYLTFDFAHVQKGLDVLLEMPTLEKINGADAKKVLDFWIKPVLNAQRDKKTHK